MPVVSEETRTPEGPRFAAHGSVAVELDWCLYAAHRPDRDLQAIAVFDFYDAHPEVAEQVRALWSPEETLSYPGYLELSTLAYHGGLLFDTDGDVFVSKLEELATTAPTDLPYAVETESDAERLRNRLRTLRRSAKRRRHYAEVVAKVWEGIRPAWESEGRAAVEAAVADRSALLEQRVSIDDFASECCSVDRLADRITNLGPEGQVVVVPAYFSRKGLTADLPGLLIVGVRSERSAAAARARTEKVARQLKAVADPTRLAILDALARREMTISDIASVFSLAQPTVSNHVKQLRDAGIVANVTREGRRLLTVRQDRVSEILDGLGETLRARPG